MILNQNTLKKIEMRNILDLSVNIENTMDLVLEKWEYDIITNKTNNIDMVSFLYFLSNRNFIVNIPKYTTMTKFQNLNGQIYVIPENRHGRLIGVQGNSKTFSFTIRIIDMNVINGDKTGEIRCFRLTDPEGNWYKGIEKLQVVNSNRNEDKIYNNIYNNIKFDYFIDPKRWIQFYSEEYFITKSLINRLKLESSYYYKCIKRMLKDGIEYPYKKELTWSKTEQKSEKKLIKLFTSEVFYPDYIEKFPEFTSNQNNLVDLTKRRNKFIYSIIPKLQFITRAIEFAYFNINQDDIPENVKKKIGNIGWKNIKIKRTDWKELNLGNLGIRKRTYKKTEVIV